MPNSIEADIEHCQSSNTTLQPRGWQNHQSKRFEILSSIGDISYHSVFDIDCASAEFYLYLKKNYRDFTYFGIDPREDYYQENLRRFQKNYDCHFFHGNFAELELLQVDYIIASGALSYTAQDSKDYLFKIIRKSFQECQQGFAFNLFDANHLKVAGLPMTYEPQLIVDFCRTLTPKVQLIEDYLKNEFTIHLHH